MSALIVGPTLKLIEANASDQPEKLQSGFEAVDSCGKISKIL